MKTRAEKDAFYGGMCAALSVVALHDDPTIYDQIVALAPYGLRRFAINNDDMELPAIRRAIRDNSRKRSAKKGPAEKGVVWSKAEAKAFANAASKVFPHRMAKKGRR